MINHGFSWKKSGGHQRYKQQLNMQKIMKYLGIGRAYRLPGRDPHNSSQQWL